MKHNAMDLMRNSDIQNKGDILDPSCYAMVIGGANMDLSGRADSKLQLGDSTPGCFSCSAGGVGRNIADNLARLGSSVEFISVMGDDNWGEQLLCSCQSVGIGVSHCLTIPGANSSSYLSILDQDGEMQLALSDMALLTRLDADVLATRYDVIQQAQVLVVDANLSQDALTYLFHKHGNKPFFVDPVSATKAKKIKPFLSKIHTLKPNRLEAEALTGMTISDDPATVEAVLAELHRLGVQRVLLSLGAKGAVASDGHGIRFISAAATQVNNVTGAGDALMAGLTQGYLMNWDWFACVEFGLAAARLALAADNTINSTMSESAVLRLLEETQC
ncbi:MAG: PfkB family carbohydrate kinase [Ferrimonas sp.]